MQGRHWLDSVTKLAGGARDGLTDVKGSRLTGFGKTVPTLLSPPLK